MTRYIPSKIEKKWQKYWETKKLFVVKDKVSGKKNFMLTAEFPYTSGNLHIGHWYTFAVSDILARYLRMRGNNVMYPIGFDAFGLPAENAAIKHGTTPNIWTKKNVAYMTRQLKSIGAVFDWTRVVSTDDPAYYKWTQWMFLKLYASGLAYRKKTQVNWCPKDKTVLANEQVVDGRCDRCESVVVQKEIEQWMFRTTAYADRLVDDIGGVDWPETTILAQKNWIGRSEGAIIKFALVGVPGQPDGRHFVEVFTTRADTLFSGTFIVISPELAKKWMDAGWSVPSEIKLYIDNSLRKRELERLADVKDKTGVFTGIYAVNPINQDKMPVWVADFVLGYYGTGAVFADAHDERDFEFAKKYDIPLKTSLRPADGSDDTRIKNLQECFTADGILYASGKYDGMTSDQARKAIVADLNTKGLAHAKQTYRLRDWVLSRQRYWGAPIPMIKCAVCGYVPVPEKDLPIKLPLLKDFLPTDDGRSPLAKATKWVKVKCPQCCDPAERETDTMDTFVDSSWYFIRYTDPKNKKTFADIRKMKAWLPVPMYIGGPEHNTMHLLYARFLTKALYDLGHVHFSEPFSRRRNHSVILGPDGRRMSKSHGNVVDPDVEAAKYGADAVRMYLAFMGPYSGQTMPWDSKGINGVYRFLNRVWVFFADYADSSRKIKRSKELDVILASAVKNVGSDIAKMAFNTGVSGLMKLFNALEEQLGEAWRVDARTAETIAKLLAPFAPHLAEEVWFTVLKHKKSIHLERWPKYDEKLLAQRFVDLPVQINGKVRDVIKVAPDTSEAQVRELALLSEAVKRHLAGRVVQKFIYVPGRMVSVVVSGHD